MRRLMLSCRYQEQVIELDVRNLLRDQYLAIGHFYRETWQKYFCFARLSVPSSTCAKIGSLAATVPNEDEPIRNVSLSVDNFEFQREIIFFDVFTGIISLTN